MRLRLAGLVIALFLYPSLLEFFCLSDIPHRLASATLYLSNLTMPLILLLTLIAGPILLIGLSIKSKRKSVLKNLGIWVLCFVALLFSAWGSGLVRHYCFAQLTVRSRPVVAAIEAYQKKKGHPPANLEAMVPEFLPKYPHTGMGAYPDFNYVTPDDTDPWRLEVPCSIGLLNWDVFFYRPSKEYGVHEYGGGVERIGDWAYVHE